MIDADFSITGFPFEQPEPAISLYAYAPVFRVRDQRGDWVIKRTGLVHSDAASIASWLRALRAKGVDVVAPVEAFGANPRVLDDGRSWVVYPYIHGASYVADLDQIAAAGELLGRIHAADPPEANALKTYSEPVIRDHSWIERQSALAANAMREHAPTTVDRFLAHVDMRTADFPEIADLPLAGCCFDFKASNLIFSPSPVLIDPDHAARIPRVYDLALAALLFHNDVPSAPGRLWTSSEWATFLAGYRRHISLTPHELANWNDVLRLAWIDQGVWLLGNFPTGWADRKEACYLSALATAGLSKFAIEAH